jgi:hypothetical protein
MRPEQIKQAASDFEEIPLIDAATRCGVRWTPWMGDWFTSWSPRNCNSNAEGTWDHWVDLAIKILQDPLTAIVRPEAHEIAKALRAGGLCTESNRMLSDGDLTARFAEPSTSSPG